MRFAERFLVALAAIALGMRYGGLKDGPTMELIALPLLAAFYLLAIPLFFLKRKRLWSLLAALCGGLALAYCIISLMLYTLRWLPRADMLVNCGILLVLLIGGALYFRRAHAFADILLTRAAILLAAILLAAIVPLSII